MTIQSVFVLVLLCTVILVGCSTVGVIEEQPDNTVCVADAATASPLAGTWLQLTESSTYTKHARSISLLQVDAQGCVEISQLLAEKELRSGSTYEIHAALDNRYFGSAVPFDPVEDRQVHIDLVPVTGDECISASTGEVETFGWVDQKPDFLDDDLVSLIRRAAQPFLEEARASRISRTLRVSAVIDKKGRVFDVSQVFWSREVPQTETRTKLEEAAIRVARSTPFIPGKHNGEVVCVRYTLLFPFRF